jgi:dTDP-4-dehydrorhamnose reductase
MTLLVFGRTGQVATELARIAPDAVFLGRDAADLTDSAACAAAIHAHAPRAVINAAAYTDVDKAESDEATAIRVNAGAPAAMAQACAALGIPLVHISTDYVFDGNGTAPRQPNDPTAPINAYGRSKLAGERGIAQAGGSYAVLRTSWVVSAHGANFVRTMLRLSKMRDALNIVDDQIGGPTCAADIAAACLTIADQLMADPAKSGIYHFAGAPDVSWKDFAQAIFAAAHCNVAVSGIPTSAYPTPAQRPLNSRLDCSATTAAFGIARPDWSAGLQHILTELKEVSA